MWYLKTKYQCKAGEKIQSLTEENERLRKLLEENGITVEKARD